MASTGCAEADPVQHVVVSLLQVSRPQLLTSSNASTGHSLPVLIRGGSDDIAASGILTARGIPIVVLLFGLLWFLLKAILALVGAQGLKEPPRPCQPVARPATRSEAQSQGHGDVETTRRSWGALDFLMDPDMLCLYYISFLKGAFSMMFVPILPKMEAELGASTFEVSLISSFFSLGSMMTAPLLGYLADVYGPTRVLMQTLSLAVLGHLTCGLETSFLLVLASRTLTGCFCSTLGVASAMVVERTEPSRRVEALALFTAVNSVGAMAAPGVAGVVSPGGHSNICFVAAGAAALCIAWLWFTKPPRVPGGTRPAAESNKVSQPVAVGLLDALMAQPVILLWFLLYGIIMIVGPMSLQNSSFFFAEKFGLPPAVIGLSTTVSGVVVVVSSVLAVRPVVRCFGEVLTLLLASAAQATCFVVQPLLGIVALQLLLALVMGGLTAFPDPCILAVATTAIPKGVLGTVMGIFAGFKAGGFVLGSMLGSLVYQVNMYCPFLLLVAGHASVAVGAGLTLCIAKK